MKARELLDGLTDVFEKNRGDMNESMKTYSTDDPKPFPLSSLDECRLLWSILTALRGPDNDDCKLKSYTTGRIRAVTGICNNWVAEVRYSPLTEDERKERDILLGERYSHFHDHYIGAVRAIKAVYGYDLETETPVPSKDVIEGGIQS